MSIAARNKLLANDAVASRKTLLASLSFKMCGMRESCA